MGNNGYLPIFQLTRGRTVESIHHGAIAVVDSFGRLVAHFGDPNIVTFLRSSAKPFQAMPFLEHGGQAYYHLSQREIAVICASHSGSDQHSTTVQGIQEKAGVSELDLLCGVHIPGDEATAEALRERKEQPRPNQHNCSGKHTGMLAYVRMSNRMDKDLPYISPQHPIQQEILSSFAEMCGLPVDQVALGVDGCSAPNFAVPLRNTAFAYARLCDPDQTNVTPPQRAAACHLITTAMMGEPEMVAGPGRFDTCLMQIAGGKLVCKGGAEGYQAIGLMPGVLAPDSPALGIALKIADGDGRGTIRHAVALQVLRQLGVLSADELSALSEFGPAFSVFNWRKILVGEGQPIFELQHES
jgi:L-asparaginase II